MGHVLTPDVVSAWEERYSNRGRWGPHDLRGALNFVTPERVLGACAVPRRGRVVSCALPARERGPHGGAHRLDARLVTACGESSSPLAAIAEGVLTRGILLDLPRFRRVDTLEDGSAILPEELDACAESQGVAVESGDAVLVRTGKMLRCRRAGSWGAFAGGAAPGLSVHCARWLHEREVSVVATDTFAVEVVPSEVPGCTMPLHRISLRGSGVLFGEIFQLDELAEACAADGDYAFLLSASPLAVAGAVGAPLNPLAIK